MHPALDQLQARIGYTFRDPTLLRSALTHTSLAAEIPDSDNNQRLEFLGDAVLQILLAEALFHLFPQERAESVEGLEVHGSVRNLVSEQGIDLLHITSQVSREGGSGIHNIFNARLKEILIADISVDQLKNRLFERNLS